MIFFIDDSKYVKGTFLVSHKKALDFNNNIFRKEQTESPCRSPWRLGRAGHGGRVAARRQYAPGPGTMVWEHQPPRCTESVTVSRRAFGELGRCPRALKEGGRKAAL